MKKTVIIFCRYENHAKFWFQRYVDVVRPIGKIKRMTIITPDHEIIFTGEARLNSIARGRHADIIEWRGDDIYELISKVVERLEAA